MTRAIRKTAAFAAVILTVGAVTAFAANSSPPLVGVTKGAMDGVHRATGANGALKPNAVGNRQIKFGSVSCRKLSADLVAALCTGKPGAPGTPGAPGADGITGSPGKNGGTGSNGTNGGTGSNGTNGGKGDKGDKGDSSAAQYGLATVNVSRGAGPAVAWGTYSTSLGSPVGDTTGGVFRFTCGTTVGNAAPCTISVKAAVLSYQGASYKVYPRVLVYSQSLAGGPETYCEYGDGSTGSDPLALVKQTPTSTPTYTDVPVNIGGSADCNGPVTTPGDVSQITVPAGYYDVNSTFRFLP